ncbi:MAG: heavy-metal-associated domain-containing protein [Pirellulaceae bacterium]|nr:heavy-metal-associated domain-containing protein [Pirellulaceae bacterium]
MIRLMFAAAFLLAGLLAVPAANATQPLYTTVVVHNMHCDACAKKIARKVYALPGVVEVRADVPKNLAYVVPQQGKTLSSRAVWEAVESAGFKVARLQSPEGNFTAKPPR